MSTFAEICQIKNTEGNIFDMQFCVPYKTYILPALVVKHGWRRVYVTVGCPSVRMSVSLSVPSTVAAGATAQHKRAASMV